MNTLEQPSTRTNKPIVHSQFFREIIVCILFIFIIVHFSCTNKKKPLKNLSLSEIILEYHKVYADLESADIYIAPIISTRFLLSLNLVVQKCSEIKLDKKINNLHKNLTFSPASPAPMDSLLQMNLLNESLSEHLSSLFENRVKNAGKIIQSKHDEISNRIKLITNNTNVETIQIRDISKNISDEVLNNIIPKDYIHFPELAFRDSIKINLQILDTLVQVTWVKNMKLYNSILPGLNVESYDFNTLKTVISPNYSDLYKNAMEIYTISQPLSHEEKWIAEFWSDDLPGVTFSPVTRWFNILNQIVDQEKPDYEKTKKIYFALAVSMHEAGVACWDYKYSFAIGRPSHLIHTYIDPHWLPFHENPDFPAYPSGHATFGSSAAFVLAYFFGQHYNFTDNSHKGNRAFLSDPRSYNSFQEMAEENAKSRMYLGVHFRKDCEDGMFLGKKIAQHVMQVLETKTNKK